MIKNVVTTFPEESLRVIADRMATLHVGVLPVVDSAEKKKLCGLITQFELLTGRHRIPEEERKRERILKMWSLSKYGTFSGILKISVISDLSLTPMKKALIQLNSAVFLWGFT